MAVGPGNTGVLTKEALAEVGSKFISTLKRLKHNGATGRCIEGFVRVAERCANSLQLPLQGTPCILVDQIVAGKIAWAMFTAGNCLHRRMLHNAWKTYTFQMIYSMCDPCGV